MGEFNDRALCGSLNMKGTGTGNWDKLIRASKLKTFVDWSVACGMCKTLSTL